MLRRLAVLLAALCLAGPAAAAGPAATFVFSGHGWGHGIGMSQYGALGYAQHGSTYTQILAHYYPSTELGAAPVARIRVLLIETKKLVTVSSAAGFRVRDGAGQWHDLAAGDYAFGRGLRLKLDGVTPSPLASPLVFAPHGSALELNGKPYRGTFTAIGGKTLKIVDGLGLEAYLYGVVPSEMPYFWSSDALKAQAIAARSYALATRQPDAPYDVFGDTRSQAYGGIAAEHGETTAAVDATKSTIVLYGGKVATTYFYSSSGGRTAAIQDEWKKAKPVPYLVSVPDPYDTLSPHHDWGPVTLTGAKIGSLLKAPGPVLDLQPAPNASGRVGTVSVTAAKGSLALDGAAVRVALGLRSTWFTIGEVSLTPTTPTIVYGSTLQLSGAVRGLAGTPLLESRWPGQAWAPVATPALSNGTFSVTASPTQTTDYRLTVGSVATTVRVPVAPQVVLENAGTALTGSVKPALAGAAVDLQRQDGTLWTSIGSAALAADGSFSAPMALEPGSYRAVVAAGGGLVAGVSPVVLVGSP
jgi:stage II sporulation protein D